MSTKEYPESVAGQASVYRLNTNELTVEFTYSKEFKAEYLKCLEIGQDVRVPVYTHPPKTAEPFMKGKYRDKFIADIKQAIVPKTEREALLNSVNLWLDNLGKPNCGNTMLLTDIRDYLRSE